MLHVTCYMLHVLTYLHTMWAIRNEEYVEERCGGRDGTSASVRSEERALFIEKECFALIGCLKITFGKFFLTPPKKFGGG